MDTDHLTSFVDEMEKLSLEESHRKALLGAGGAVLGLGAGAAAVLARRPGLRQSMLASLKGAFRGGARAVEGRAGLHGGSKDQAKAVASALMSHGLNPAEARLGLAGAGGTGKSTLSRALAERTGIKAMPMDKGKGLWPSRTLKRLLSKGTPAGTIAEQTHLLTEVNPDKFDAILHVEKPLKRVRKQLLSRGRGAWQQDYYDMPGIQKAIRKAFDSADGKLVQVADGVQMKIKTGPSFRSNENLARELRERGFGKGQVKNLSRAAKINLLTRGTTGEGAKSFLRKGRIAGDVATVLTGSAAGGFGGAALSERRRKNRRR